jgi:hypothetical protein
MINSNWIEKKMILIRDMQVTMDFRMIIIKKLLLIRIKKTLIILCQMGKKLNYLF